MACGKAVRKITVGRHGADLYVPAVRIACPPVRGLLLYTQIAIIFFVLVGIVIAIVKL